MKFGPTSLTGEMTSMEGKLPRKAKKEGVTGTFIVSTVYI